MILSFCDFQDILKRNSYLFEGQSEHTHTLTNTRTHRERERISYPGSLAKWPERQRLVKAEARKLEHNLGVAEYTRICAFFCCFPRHISEEHNEKQNNWNSSQHPYIACLHCRQQLNLLHPYTSPFCEILPV